MSLRRSPAPAREPDAFSGQNVDHGVAHRAHAAPHIPCELLGRQLCDSSQHARVCPAVAFEQRVYVRNIYRWRHRYLLLDGRLTSVLRNYRVGWRFVSEWMQSWRREKKFTFTCRRRAPTWAPGSTRSQWRSV